MKRLLLATSMLLAVALLSLPALAGEPTPSSPAKGPRQQLEKKPVVTESEGQSLNREHIRKREEIRGRRDEGLKEREQHINQNDPGNTGL